jgi:hypothetical protein
MILIFIMNVIIIIFIIIYDIIVIISIIGIFISIIICFYYHHSLDDHYHQYPSLVDLYVLLRSAILISYYDPHHNYDHSSCYNCSCSLTVYTQGVMLKEAVVIIIAFIL